MPKHFYTLMVFTFLTGLISGFFIYFTTRGESTVSSRDYSEDRGYEIVATTYGGCERIGCASIRLLDDGTYTYLVNGQEDSYERYEDTISSRQKETLTELLKTTSLNDIADSSFTGTCPAAYDGLAYRFSIRYEAEYYEFDSCQEALEGVPLFEELSHYFNIMDATYGSS